MNWASLLIAIQSMDPIVAVMATIMVMFFIYRSGVNLFPKLKKRKIERRQTDPQTLQELHKTCPNYSSFQVIIERVMEKSDKIFRLKYQDTIYEQMNEAELMWEKILDILVSHFTKTFDFLNPKALKADRSFMITSYTTILTSMEVQVLGSIRRYMRKNHFIEKNEVEYDAYIVDKSQLLYDKMIKLFDRTFDEERLLVNATVLREDLIDHCMPEITKIVRTFFLKAKVISLEKHNLIKKLEAEITGI